MKFRSLAASCGAFLLFSGAALAVDAGWRVQFHHDAFEDKTYPLAHGFEGSGFGDANLGMACLDGGVAVTFYDGQMRFGGPGPSAKFRDSEGGVHEFRFEFTDLPPFGSRIAITGEAASDLVGVFHGARGAVPYQTGEKQGTLPVAGFAQVHEIMTEHCAEL